MHSTRMCRSVFLLGDVQNVEQTSGFGVWPQNLRISSCGRWIPLADELIVVLADSYQVSVASSECGDRMYMMVNSYAEIRWITRLIRVHRGDVYNCRLKTYYCRSSCLFPSYSLSRCHGAILNVAVSEFIRKRGIYRWMVRIIWIPSCVGAQASRNLDQSRRLTVPQRLQKHK